MNKNIIFYSLILLLAACNPQPTTDKPAGEPPPLLFTSTNVMVHIPPEEFIMGTDPQKEKQYPNSFGFVTSPYENEIPQRKVYVNSFYLDRYEVTIRSYKEFLDSTGHKPPNFWDKIDVAQWENYPIAYVSWQDAAAYAEWAGKRLPTEEEWEKAARGTDGRRYPWGDEYDKEKGNFSTEGILPIGVNKSDVSPYGIYDMGGNISEWTVDWYKPYPENPHVDEYYGERFRVIKGGSFGGKGHYFLPYFIRSAFRNYILPEKKMRDLGFRCAISLTKVDAVKLSERDTPSPNQADNMVYIAAGEFIMGSKIEEEAKYPAAFGFKKSLYENESPQRRVYVEAFYIDKYEVSCNQYKQFLDSTGYFRTPKHWEKIDFPSMGEYPVQYIAWEDANAYAQWAGKRLPTEAEWEKAARGTDGRRYPWGNEFNQQKVDSLAFDISPYGVYNMGENVAEWTVDWYKPYPDNDYPDDNYGERYKVVRGGMNIKSGHYKLDPHYSRCAYRTFARPTDGIGNLGLRCAKSP